MRRLLSLVVLMLALGAGGGGVLAQDDGPSPDSPTRDREDGGTTDDEDADGDDATPEADDPAGDEPLPTAPDGRLDLAAMTLDTEELPEGYQLVSEAYVDLDALTESLSDRVPVRELQAIDIVRYYETTYLALEGGRQIRSYVIEYPNVYEVEDGFAILEDEELMVPGESGLEDAPGPAGVGEEPSEITTGTYGPTGAEQSSVDITFRIDRLAVGVALETFDGSEPDGVMAEALAGEQERRVVAALTGEAIPNVEPGLVDGMVTFEGVTTFEGYQSVEDGYGSAGTAAADGFVATYVRGATFSEDPAATIAPYVTVGVSAYEDEEAVLAVLGAADDFVPQFPGLEVIDVPLVDGSPTVGYSFESLILTDDVASVRLFVAIDDDLLSIDVQGFASTDDALAAALEVAEVAAGCIDGGDCGPVGLPDGVGDADDGTPAALPVTEDEDDGGTL